MVLVVVLYLVGAQVPLAYLLLAQGLLTWAGRFSACPGVAAPDSAYAALLSPYLSAQPLAFSLLVWRTYNFYWFLILGAPHFPLSDGGWARNLWHRQALGKLCIAISPRRPDPTIRPTQAAARQRTGRAPGSRPRHAEPGGILFFYAATWWLWLSPPSWGPSILPPIRQNPLPGISFIPGK